ncbi:unannotated protein [freshwater metagenome]|uniref:Unannotated protein n=1 Tax=freshwater metagenome TaxID=449393 RepID=A0A6J7G9D6_9ZZZZ|nr:hypothetical protein [Actinomycetota bacterium]
MPIFENSDETEQVEYHDDIDVVTGPESDRKRISLGFAAKALVSILGVSIFFSLGNTFAGNIRINSTGTLEYGQGIAVAAACSSTTPLTLTPNATLINAPGNGASFYFQSVTVSNIPAGCTGADFEISAYGTSSSTPLAIFNSTATKAIVYNNAGTFIAGYKTSGVNISSGSGTFTITFNTPAALASAVAKVTLQSTNHTPWPCSDGGPCEIGETGPGGGIVFYVNPTGFNCGASFSSTGSPSGGKCNYMELAPYNWSTLGADPHLNWSTDANRATAVPGLTLDAGWSLGAGNNVNSAALAAVIGQGLQQTNLIVAQNGTCANSATCTYAAGAAKAYTSTVKGVLYSDWYLGNIGEVNNLCKYATAQTGTPDTRKCSGGEYVSAPFYGSGTLLTNQAQGGFSSSYYSSSDQGGATGNFRFDLRSGQALSNFTKETLPCAVRPIRAF